jgi:glycosyltransferase involved in cell wall biosynthesis
MVSKYPPIQGGESSKAYWLLRGLGARGHEMHVVTNALEVETTYREALQATDLDNYQPPGVYLHNTNPFSNPSYIPYAKPYAEKLASLAIETIRHYDLSIIDSWYLLPYGIAAFMAKMILDKPLILRHAGSDISRLYKSPDLFTLFTEIFKRADRIVTYTRFASLFASVGVSASSLYLNDKVSVDTTAFHPDVPPMDLLLRTAAFSHGIPTLTYLGKFDRTKGIFEMLEALEGIDEDFLLLLVIGSLGRDRLTPRIQESPLSRKTVFMDFMPPWQIPSLLRASTCVVHPEREFPIVGHSPILPREVMAAGTCLVLSKELYDKRVSDQIRERDSVLVVNPKDVPSFREVLRLVIKNPALARSVGERAREVSERIENFPSYLDSMERLYADLS